MLVVAQGAYLEAGLRTCNCPFIGLSLGFDKIRSLSQNEALIRVKKWSAYASKGSCQHSSDRGTDLGAQDCHFGEALGRRARNIGVGQSATCR